MSGHGITKRSQHRSANVRDFLFQIFNQPFDARALQVRLGTAQVTWDDWKLRFRGELRDITLATESERPNDRVAPIIRTEHRTHRLQRGDVEEIQQGGCD